MTRYDFYHLQKSSLEQILPKLCEKAYMTGQHIRILVGNEARVEFINSLLWTYNEESFLPHGSKKDGFTNLQPIFISDFVSENLTNENNATLLFLVDGAMPSVNILNDYQRVLNIFDGNDSVALNNARQYWKSIKEAGGELHYWQQNDTGAFEQKM